MESGAASIIGGLQLSAFLEQALHSLDVAPLSSHMPGCVAIVVGHIQAAPLLTVWGQQELNGITSPTCMTTAVLSGPMQQCTIPSSLHNVQPPRNCLASARIVWHHELGYSLTAVLQRQCNTVPHGNAHSSTLRPVALQVCDAHHHCSPV